MEIVGSVRSSVTPEPLGDVSYSGTDTAALGSMTNIVEYVPEDGVKFELTKVQLACLKSCWIEVLVDTEVVTYGIVGDAQPFVDWFPSGDACALIGDGTKSVKLRAQAVTAEGAVKGVMLGGTS